jgi:4,5-dihydroxyphthalate decarboxylase
MSDITLKTAIGSYGQTRPVKDGTVRPSTFQFAFEEVTPIIKAFRRMVRGLEFDVCEMAITTYMCARAHGKRFTCIPAFIVRQFPHDAIVYNTQTGVSSPKDLEGRKVGVNRGYTVTNGLWARAVLQHHYGVDLNRVTWVLSGDEHVAEWQRPANVVPMEQGKRMEDMLASGEVVAAIGVSMDSPDIKPLIPNPQDAAIQSLRERNFWPINHAIAIKDEVLAAHPEIAVDLFHLFAEAKRMYMTRLKAGEVDLTGRDKVYDRVMKEIGDPLPYGIEPNRATLEAVIQHAVEQGVIPRHYTVEELFVPSTLHLIA